MLGTLLLVLLASPAGARPRRDDAPSSPPVLESAVQASSPSAKAASAGLEPQGRLDRWTEARTAFLELCGTMIEKAADASSDPEDVRSYVDGLRREAYEADQESERRTGEAVRRVKEAFAKGDIGKREADRGVLRLENARKLAMLDLYGRALPARLDEAVRDPDGRPSGSRLVGEGWKTFLTETELKAWRRRPEFNADGLDSYYPQAEPKH